MKENKIITIGRQIGSGGSQIGMEVAKRLGIKCYDKQLIELASSYGELEQKVLEEAEEKRPNPFLYSVPRQMQNDKTGRGIAINDMVFNVQSEVIRQLAAKESCVLIGRCADYVLREQPGVTSVFIYADMNDRICRLMEARKITRDEAITLIKKTDKSRRNYYECYTGKRWGAGASYDVTLNSAELGFDTCVDLICHLYERKQEGETEKS
ncbi:cytidylate kinase-like family protein [Clostridium sp. OM02-18AC]|uniref:cytidylate kinase-like family protein n=1 Tax=Clostridium sp. OM02-18AC TaxID=2292311 RepID=UPI000E4C2DA4|nr:cytidylate kinase-like family protein [Clostridium sp. OM02-18AC]RHV63383.1 cytidylate kinase-like family protein [Clostridium sp. OM02-18AC]